MVSQYSTNKFAKCRFTTVLQICSQGAYSQFVRKGRVLQQFLQYSHRCSVPRSYSFYLQYTGEWGSGLTFISFATILFFCLNSICQQQELPLFLVACGREILFILFWGGKGDRGYLYFLSPLRGF